MRTNIDIDDKLIAEAMAVFSVRTKRQAVERALREAIDRHKTVEALLSLRGRVQWEGDLDAMRRDG